MSSAARNCILTKRYCTAQAPHHPRQFPLRREGARPSFCMFGGHGRATSQSHQSSLTFQTTDLVVLAEDKVRQRGAATSMHSKEEGVEGGKRDRVAHSGSPSRARRRENFYGGGCQLQLKKKNNTLLLACDARPQQKDMSCRWLLVLVLCSTSQPAPHNRSQRETAARTKRVPPFCARQQEKSREKKK